MDLAPSPTTINTSNPVLAVEYKSASFSVGVADVGKVFICNGPLAITLGAAATLGSNFYFWVQSFPGPGGTITVNANAADDISEATATNVVVMANAGDSALFVCAGDPSSGWNWMTFGSITAYRMLNYWPLRSIPGDDAVLIPVVHSGAESWYRQTVTTTLSQNCFSANRNGVIQTGVASATPTKVKHNTEEFDPFGEYDNVTNFRYTPLRQGKYLVVASVEVQSIGSTGNYVNSYIYKNGALAHRGRDWGANATTSDLIPVATAVISMNGSTDYLEHYVYQNDGGTRSVEGAVESTYFMACRIST